MKVTFLVCAATLLRPFALVYYAAIKLLRPVQHKVTFISRQSDSTPVDFVLLAAALTQLDRSLKIKILCCSEATRSTRFLGQLRQTSRELWHIASSSAVVLDGYALSISFFSQRKELYVLQMWHTLGVVKRISWQAVDTPGGRDSRIAQAFRMHANYTALLAPSEALRENYRHAFRTARARIKLLPLPRYDVLRNPDMNRLDMIIANHQEFFAATPLVFYAPTFRDDAEESRQWIAALKKLAQAAEAQGVTLIAKTHLRETALAEGQNDELAQLSDLPNLILNPAVDTLDLLAIVDHVITDYSGISFEAAVSGKPVWFYLYDYNDYVSKRGLNVDPMQHLPAACFADARELMDAFIHSPLPSAAQEQFLHNFIQPPERVHITAAQQIARLVLKGIQ